MLRNFDAEMTDLDGKPFADAATLKSVAFAALTASLDGDNALSLDARLKQFTLLQKIHIGGMVDVTSDEISLIKTRAAKCLSLIAVGRLCEMLESDPPSPALKAVE